MRRTSTSERHGTAQAHGEVRDWIGGYVVAVAATMTVFFAIGLLVLGKYPLHHFSYPIGWDSPYYVWRSAAVTVDGLERLGSIRAGSPLLVGMLMQITKQNGFTLVPVATAVFAGMAALGGAAMARASLGISAPWIVIVGTLTWIGFGHIGMIGGHLDNVLNAGFVLPAFAAAIPSVAERKGAPAVALLLVASALAEWPFYVVAVAVLVLSLAIFGWPAMFRSAGRRELFEEVRPLLIAVGISVAVTAATFLWRSSGRLLHYFDERGRMIIRSRFLERLGDRARWYAVPLAAWGGIFLATRSSRSDRTAQRMFVSLMAAWVILTMTAGVVQIFDIPVAGARLLNYLFAVPLLAAVAVWALARKLGNWAGLSGRVLGWVIVTTAVVGFGWVAWRGEADREPWISSAAVRQASAAGAYSTALGHRGSLVFLQGPHRQPWNVLLASLPPELVPNARRVSGPTDDPGKGEIASASGDRPVVFLLKAYNRAGYRESFGTQGWEDVAAGVLVRAPNAIPAFAPPLPPTGSLDAISLTWVVLLVVTVLGLTGGGWAAALLPADPSLRVMLAPALGAAVLSLAALLWDRFGLGFSTIEVWVLVGMTAATGWGAAVFLSRGRGITRIACGEGRGG